MIIFIQHTPEGNAYTIFILKQKIAATVCVMVLQRYLKKETLLCIYTMEIGKYYKSG